MRDARAASRPAQRGVSLVEAVVAMAVMAFGMMAIVALQSTMRLNSDVAKQRSEAVRIAEEAIEQWRGFAVLPVTAGVPAYGDIATEGAAVVAGYTTNTDYTLTRTVTDVPAQGYKSLQAVVSWLDRSGQLQSVTLNTMIAAADPRLSGVLSLSPVDGAPLRQPMGRSPAIPKLAKNLGDGTSAFKPSGASGATVVLVFNNLTGVIAGVCNGVTADQNALTTADVAGCNNNATGQALSGFVRFSTGMTQPTAIDAQNPTSTALNLAVSMVITSAGHPSPDHLCFADAPEATPTTSTAVPYFCAVFTGLGGVWSGISTLVPLAFTVPAGELPWVIAANAADATLTSYRVCRYTPAANDSAVIPNAEHPRSYSNVGALQPLSNQNFLVIRAGNGSVAFTCPTDVPANPSAGDFVNSNTLPHQPPP